MVAEAEDTRTITGIRATQRVLGADRLSALMTTTTDSLQRVEEIIDTYVDLGLRSIFLRPISPYGFARRTRGGADYGVTACWISTGADSTTSLDSIAAARWWPRRKRPSSRPRCSPTKTLATSI
jgi:hypothetical protein